MEAAGVRSKLQDTLVDRDMTLVDLARATGLTPQAIHRIVKDQNRGIEFNTLELICSVLDCRVSDVIDYMPGGTQE